MIFKILNCPICGRQLFEKPYIDDSTPRLILVGIKDRTAIMDAVCVDCEQTWLIEEWPKIKSRKWSKNENFKIRGNYG